MGGEELAKEVCNFEQTRLDARLYSFGEAERCLIQTRASLRYAPLTKGLFLYPRTPIVFLWIGDPTRTPTSCREPTLGNDLLCVNVR